MRVSPVHNYILNKNVSHNVAFKDEVQKKDNKSLYVGAAVAGATVLASAIYFVASRGRKKPSIHLENSFPLSPTQIKLFINQMQEFPNDIAYRQNILAGFDPNITNTALLRPIAGPEEFKSIVRTFSDNPKHYSPGKNLVTELQDGFDLSGVENGTFRANLHVHTNHSDGKLSVKELLDRSAEYADKIADKIPANEAPHAPYTVAITDHDTLEGCKEAVKIIAADPMKYRNLRVVLGCELTVENRMLQQGLKSPVPIHMLIHGINPFDAKLGAFIEKTKVARVELVNSMLSKASNKLSKVFPETAKKFSYEDAELLYPAFKHRFTHMDYCSKDYMQFRTIFSECFENNPEIQSALAEKGIKTNYAEPKEKYFGGITQSFGHHYWKKYQLALQKYTADLLGIPESEAAKKITVSTKLENVLQELEQISTDASPRMNLGKAFNDMEESINLVKSLEEGFVSIAHPGLTGIGNCLNNPAESMQAMRDMMRLFKEKGGDRALGAEIHYHYFGEVGKSVDWLNSIKSYAKEAGLLNTGGIDTHGKSIFHSVK